MRYYFVAYVLLVGFFPVFAQTVSDPYFKVSITDAVYEEGQGPLVYYDTYHNNPFSLTGQYKAFADVLKADGYRVNEINQSISLDALKLASVFVTVNALSDLEKWDLPNPSVYSDQEIEALYHWVHDEGGSLFLIADHMPSAGAVSALAARFGFNFINGFTERMDRGAEIFSKARNNLLNMKVTATPAPQIDSIRCSGGSGFIAPLEAEVISVLGKDYRIYLPSKLEQMHPNFMETVPYISGQHIANGAILECGRGRVCVFADGSPFTAQLQGVNSQKRGMNHPDGTQHVQFLRNIIHWLDHRF